MLRFPASSLLVVGMLCFAACDSETDVGEPNIPGAPDGAKSNGSGDNEPQGPIPDSDEPVSQPPLTGSGECSLSPFGTYTVQLTPPACREGYTPSREPSRLIFGAPNADGTRSTTYDGDACLESWRGCTVVLDCAVPDVILEFTFAADNSFKGRAYDGCSCSRERGAYWVDCDGVATKDT